MIVVDTSVAAKWVLEGEIYKEKSIKILSNHFDGVEKVLVPDLFFYEIANTLATKTKLSQEEINDSLKVIFQAELDVKHSVESDIYKAASQAKKYKTSVYDMLYAVVAKENNATLITADEKFIEKTGFKFVIHIKDY
jgi:predicted nucleic acid-binding protein